MGIAEALNLNLSDNARKTIIVIYGVLIILVGLVVLINSLLFINGIFWIYQPA